MQGYGTVMEAVIFHGQERGSTGGEEGVFFLSFNALLNHTVDRCRFIVDDYRAVVKTSSPTVDLGAR